MIARSTVAGRVRSFGRVGARLGAAALIDAFGTGCFLAGSALFFTRRLGLSPGLIGLGLTLSGVIGFATTVPWGRAADRWGGRRILVVLLCIRAVAFLLYAFAASFAAFLAIAALLGVAEKASSPIQQALVGEAVGDERRQQVLGVMRSTRNVGFAAGAVAAAAAVSTATAGGYDAIVLLNAASFVVAAMVIGTLPLTQRGWRRHPVAPARRWRLRDGRYARLTVLNGMLTLHMSLLSVGLPLWLLRRTATPAAVIPLLPVVNAVIAVVFQVPVAGLVRSVRAATTALGVAGIALAACCVAMPLAAGLGAIWAVAMAMAGVVALTVAELAQAAGGWDLSFRFAPEQRRGHYLGVFSLGTTAQTMVGPVLLTAVVFPAGWVGWGALAGLTLVAALLASTTVSDRVGGR